MRIFNCQDSTAWIVKNISGVFYRQLFIKGNPVVKFWTEKGYFPDIDDIRILLSPVFSTAGLEQADIVSESSCELSLYGIGYLCSAA